MVGLMPDGRDVCLQAQRPERLHRIWTEVQAGTDLGELRRLLEDIDLETTLVQGQGGRQPINTATNDCNVEVSPHLSPGDLSGWPRGVLAETGSPRDWSCMARTTSP